MRPELELTRASTSGLPCVCGSATGEDGPLRERKQRGNKRDDGEAANDIDYVDEGEEGGGGAAPLSEDEDEDEQALEVSSWSKLAETLPEP